MSAKPTHALQQLPELLAPAGSPEALSAALHAGADSVYFGLDSGFNARARATNFTEGGLPTTVRRIHRAGAKAYLALNTLVFEAELPTVERILRTAAAAGVDAIIVQDPAVALLARAIAPELHVHASTQMTVASAEAARFAAALGARRVVLPRELSLPQIRQFTEHSPIEAEVFVHGAQCVAWSGQCLTSEAWGQRSANRGQCAQSCRMPYATVLDGAVKDLGDVRYLLSPQDLAALPLLPQLLELKLAGLKIEGRQKGPAYVATAVQSYRAALDRAATTEATGAHVDYDNAVFADAALRRMALSYSRGFSPGFLGGANHQRLVEGRFPKHRGLYVGLVRHVDLERNSVRVERDTAGRPWTGAALREDAPAGPEGQAQVPLPRGAYRDSALAVSVERGTGIVFDSGHPEDELEPGGPAFAVRTTAAGWDIGFGQPGPNLELVQPGMRVWATADAESTSITQSAGREPERLGGHAIALQVRGACGEPLQVRAQVAEHHCSVTSAMPLQASTGRGLDAVLLADKLGGFGGTIFRLGALDAQLPEGLHLPVTELKRLRRLIVEQFEPLVERGPVYAIAENEQLPALQSTAQHAADMSAGSRRSGAALPREADAVQLIPLVRTMEQLTAALAFGAREVELDFMDFTGLAKAVAAARQAGARVIIATVRVQKPGEEAYDRRIENLKPDGVLVRHLGAVMHFAEHPTGLPLHGDFSLNVTNSLTAAHFLGLGLRSITASHDLDETQLFALLAGGAAERITVVLRQRMATFHTEHCVYAHLLSAGRDHLSCGRPCEKHELSLQDHKGLQHPVLVDVGCRNTVFNAEAQTSAPLIPRLLEAGVRRFRCEFVREDSATVQATLHAFDAALQGRAETGALIAALGLKVQQGVSHTHMELMV